VTAAARSRRRRHITGRGGGDELVAFDTGPAKAPLNDWMAEHGLGAATLTAFIGAAVGRGIDQLPRRPESVIVCGGGRKNPAILDSIRQRADVTPASGARIARGRR
jgi:1,6-anhydro-N-acetylmuramate kinase